MINIITNDFGNISGHTKVVQNLIKGLDLIKYPYVINKKMSATKKCYIPNYPYSLFSINKDTNCKFVFGPNLFVLPTDIPDDIKHKIAGGIYLQPCLWAKEVFHNLNFDYCDLRVWATGIDTYKFVPFKDSKEYVLIYHKKRDWEELENIKNILKRKNEKFKVIEYGNYNETEYIELLKKTKYIIWHGRHESQGIALQEALSCNIPMIIYDVNTLFDAVGDNYKFPEILKEFKVTAAPYFDETCGIKIKELKELADSIDYLRDNIENFSPREYILKNLSLEKQSIELVKMYEKWDLTLSEGKKEILKTNKDFRINTVSVFNFKMKRFIKQEWKNLKDS